MSETGAVGDTSGSARSFAEPDSADPFGTAQLRAGVLAAWRDSPTRLREDAAVETDLVRAGYRDRLLTELAQNAADAAAAAGIPGRIVVRCSDRTLSISNTGAPLDLAGVHALTALRSSGKTGGPGEVGRFGVGFTAVLAVSEEIEFRSTSGSLRFSREDTSAELAAAGVALPEREGGFTPPVLRLAWPHAAAPCAGADSEIVLRLRPEIDPAPLLESMRAEAVDLLLELPALTEIRIEDFPARSTVRDMGETGLREIRVDAAGAEEVWWEYRTARARWLVPVRDGRPVAARPDVLRAPTRSDEELTLPALLIADIPMQPDRRRVLPGARLRELAAGYADFARALPPASRPVLIPAPGFARSEIDGLLRESILEELRDNPWLPVFPAEPGGAADPSDNRVAAPTRTSVFPDLTAELAELLGDVLDPLLIPDLSGARYADVLATVGVHRIGLARVAELSAGLDRPPSWWFGLYAALEPFVTDQLAVEELGALAVPLADGRTVTGPRTVLLDDELAALADPIPVHWARLVHPAAAHPLLARLGARRATPADLLSDPALQAELTDHPDDPDTVESVLRLAAVADTAALPPWLGMLELPDSEGATRPADELLLPDAPLIELLVPDSPFGVVSTEVAGEYGAGALRAIGVGWDFGIVTETDPTGPDHDLDDEETWWAGLSEDPPELIAVRDLDLVDDAAWPEALWRLLSDERTRPLLGDADGYTAWWLRRYARIDGVALGGYRHPADTEFAGLLPELPITGLSGPDLDALIGCLADPAALDLSLAATLLEALADPAKTPTPEVVARVHSRLGAAVHRLDITALDPPDRVRALSGAVIDAGDALVLDKPWFGLAVPPDRLVAADPDTAADLAVLLDLPPVSEQVDAEVLDAGHETGWDSEPLGVVLRRVFALPPQPGGLRVHDDLRVRLSGAVTRTVRVPWWQDGDTVHVLRPGPVH
ncbi:sacsin N-terminal ATP-binding-like domain-containing protein [Nocardia carnea]|uniref:sacsin N-terminal ATP-binding-like domain-containing protein n=1 Tax=Nocardia carnea TaxID=37328 RepID=UPI00245498A5|nr:ATP-binding protein [Nocardia carnea]